MIKICKYGDANNCIGQGSVDDFIGNSCFICVRARNRRNYEKKREELLQRKESIKRRKEQKRRQIFDEEIALKLRVKQDRLDKAEKLLKDSLITDPMLQIELLKSFIYNQ